MKKKLDLNGLLSKYQGISNTHSGAYYSPAKDYNYGKDLTVEQDFYQSRPAQLNYNAGDQVTYVQPIIGNFQMSKSECETFLLRIKDELRNQERNLQNIVDSTYKHIHERFQANHQKIKREILELLDRSFKQNQRFITDQLKKQGSAQPPQFMPVHKQIAAIDEEVNKLLYGLKGNQYRQSIANTVVYNFEREMSLLGQSLASARENYVNSLGQVEPDRSRIDCIREDLHKLFRLNKKTVNLVANLFANVAGGGQQSRTQYQQQQQQQQNPPNQQSQWFPGTQSQQAPVNNQGQNSTRQRKSFFNFLGGN